MQQFPAAYLAYSVEEEAALAYAWSPGYKGDHVRRRVGTVGEKCFNFLPDFRVTWPDEERRALEKVEVQPFLCNIEATNERADRVRLPGTSVHPRQCLSCQNHECPPIDMLPEVDTITGV